MVAAYALPAVAAWTVLGIGLAALPLAGLPLAGPALVLTAIYAGCYGVQEVTGRAGLPPPGRRWQVPQTMVLGVPGRRRVLVWGSILGPGFLTRNPYAGFGLLPLVIATAGGGGAVVLAAVIGLAHGTGRALALLRDARPGTGADPLRLVLTSMYWRALDGFVLLVIGGAAITACVHQFA